MSQIISEENQKHLKDPSVVMDESEAPDVKNMKNHVIVKTTILIKRADYARIKKICDILNISFGEYTGQGLALKLDGDVNDWEYLGEQFSDYLQRIKDINQ